MPKKLLLIAEGDLDSAVKLSETDVRRLENVCYLAQQAVEKALKAVLCWKEIPVPFVHDAAVLVAKLAPEARPKEGYSLQELTPYATVRRYEEGPFSVTRDDVKAVLGAAESVVAWAKSVIQ